MAHPERPPILSPPGQHFIFVLIDSRPKPAIPMMIFFSPLDGALVGKLNLNRLDRLSQHSDA
jgi:hypothetical protein